MLDVNILITIIPPVLTAVFAYLIARKKNVITERMNRAKVDADVQSQALNIVRGVITDMRDEFKRELDELRKENATLKHEIENNRNDLKNLQEQLDSRDAMIDTLQSEISALKKTVNLYEAEIERLRKKEK